MRSVKSRFWVGIVIAAVLLVALAIASSGSFAAADGEWAAYASTNASTRYSPLDQIDARNVKDLRVVWRQSVTPTDVRQAIPSAPVPIGTENTPLAVGGLLYISTGAGTVAALDGLTGKVVWFDVPPMRNGRRAIGSASRGVAYWTDGQDARVIAITGQFMTALNAKTGRRYPEFGQGGEVDLSKGYTRPSSEFHTSSPPLVVGDVIVVGGMGGPVGDAYIQGYLALKEGWPGDVRGFDVRTGKQLWIFHTVPREGELGVDTWLEKSWEYSGDANAWAPLTADDELGYIYFATGSATGDYWGGLRPGNNLFANSIVCLEAKTGKRVWHFQTVHHDLWDYDLGSAPILVDITANGRKVKAVAQVSKHSFVFVLDRTTGQPVWPIEERPVPKGDVPREWYSPTQPFPTKPPAYDVQGVTTDELVDFTPELKREAERIISQYRYGPIFTPPSLLDGPDGKKGTILHPGTISTVWNGGAVDPETGILYVPSNQTSTVVALVPPSNRRSNLPWVRQKTGFIEGPQGLPTPFKPPYGRLVAVDLNRGEILWSVANGDGPRDHPALKHLNLPPLGHGGRAAPLITKTLVFFGEGSNISPSEAISPRGGKKLRAFDKRTGHLVGEIELPGGTTGGPMTYLANGKQYIAVTVGWESMPAEVIAMSLP